MVSKVAGVLVVLKGHREGHGVVGLFLLQESPPVIGDIIIVAVVGDLGACPDPALLIQPKSCLREHQGLHAIVELAVRLLTVDDVEAIGHPGFVVGDFEVEPLVMMHGVDVSIKEEIVFMLTNLQHYIGT